jgi:hypothetical protein
VPVYRDDERAVTERIEALERAIAAKERLLPALVRERLPRELCDRISVYAELPPDRDPMRRADDLTANLEALEEALALVPRLREDLLALPGSELVLPRRPAVSSKPLLGDVSLEADRTKLSYILLSLDPEASIWVDGTSDYGAVCAALQPEGEPVGLIVTLYRMRLIDTQLAGSSYSAHKEPEPRREPEGQAWTRLAPGTPPLLAYPQGFKETVLLKPLGLRRDVQVGEPDLDGRFMFDGDEDVVQTLIVERVRRGLVAMDSTVADKVRLSIEDSGIATLTWDGETDERVLRGAVDVLVGLRSVSIEPLLDARGL